MPVARNPGNTSLVDILDRVLDQGIRFEGNPRAALTQGRTPPEQGRTVIAAVKTHLESPEDAPGETGTGA